MYPVDTDATGTVRAATSKQEASMAKREDTPGGTATPGLSLMTSPLAELVAASDDPKAVLAEIFSELVGESIVIEREAMRYLQRGGAR
jgi:hypothetical protein